jgi:hypothetical protein
MFHWLKKIGSYFHRDAVAVDQTVNVFAGGHNDETISARAERGRDQGHGASKVIGTVLSDGLDVIQKDHGQKAEQGDLQRAQTVEQIESESLKENPLPKE